MTNRTRIGVATALALLVAQTAQAHTGVGPTASLATGILHPLTGMDHLLAMVAVGAWAGMRGGRMTWLVPTSFVAALIVGGLLGVGGVTFPLVELGIIGSLIVLGLLIAADLQLGPAVAMAVVALFGLFHGHAHGTEMPVDGHGLLYGLGFVAATAALHLVGIAGSRMGAQGTARPWLRWGGGAVAAAGFAFVIAG